jgi:hypothetical protein
MINNEVLAAGDALRNHPYTLLSLSDREKFHTGFIAYCLRRYRPTLFKRLFDSNEYPETIDVEQDSIDLVVKGAKGRYLGIAEVKLKTDLHDEQLDKYNGKVLANLKNLKIKNDAVGRIVIGLFSPVDERQLNEASFTFVDLTETLRGLIVEELLKEQDSVIRTLIGLWTGYLEGLDSLKSYFIQTGTGSINGEVPGMLETIRLRGIFERYRHRLVADNLRNSAPDLVDLDKEGGGPIDISNSHGNGILDMYVLPRKGKVQFGLQWQAGTLKLFIHHQKESPRRNELLLSIAEEIVKSGVVPEIPNPTLNRKGVFRSVTIGEVGWNVLSDDISNSHCKLIEIFRRLQEYRDDVIHLQH